MFYSVEDIVAVCGSDDSRGTKHLQTRHHIFHHPSHTCAGIFQPCFGTRSVRCTLLKPLSNRLCILNLDGLCAEWDGRNVPSLLLRPRLSSLSIFSKLLPFDFSSSKNSDGRESVRDRRCEGLLLRLRLLQSHRNTTQGPYRLAR